MSIGHDDPPPTRGGTSAPESHPARPAGRADIGRTADPDRWPPPYPGTVFDEDRWGSTLRRVAQPVATFGIAGLLFVDATIGRRVLHAHGYATLAGLVVLAAVTFRRHSPTAAALFAAAASVAVSLMVARADLTVWSRFIDGGSWPGLAESVGLVLLAGLAARSATPPAAIAAVGAVAAALVAACSVRYDGPYSSVLTALALAGLAVTVGVGAYVRDLDERRRRESIRTRQDERMAIARELHDVVAHHVTGIVVQAQAARLVADSRPDAVADALAEIERAGSEAMGAMRNLVGSLRDERDRAPLAPLAAMTDVRALAERSAALGLPVRLHVEDVDDALPGDVAMSVHRIVREALTNARRHAQDATSVDVWIQQVDTDLRITVRDDGRRLRASRSTTGFGLTGMAERANALGGRFMAGPLPEGGWMVRALLPLQP
jgi:signal transduction histidine kinase